LRLGDRLDLDLDFDLDLDLDFVLLDDVSDVLLDNGDSSRVFELFFVLLIDPLFFRVSFEGDLDRDDLLGDRFREADLDFFSSFGLSSVGLFVFGLSSFDLFSFGLLSFVSSSLRELESSDLLDEDEDKAGFPLPSRDLVGFL